MSSSKIIILGIAPCLEEDLSEIIPLIKDDCDFMAVGLDCSDRIRFDIQHACSYHPEEFFDFKRRRAAIGCNTNYRTHSHAHGESKANGKFAPDFIWPLIDRSPLSGSSSFLGAQAAVGLGYKKVVLCGCPMEGKNIQRPKASEYSSFQQGWEKHVGILKGRVRSVSGWTMRFLGYPTEEWLNDGQ